MLAGMQLDLFMPFEEGIDDRRRACRGSVVWAGSLLLSFGVKAIGVSFEIVQGSGVFATDKKAGTVPDLFNGSTSSPFAARPVLILPLACRLKSRAYGFDTDQCL
jgi:hypothetical protein